MGNIIFLGRIQQIPKKVNRVGVKTNIRVFAVVIRLVVIDVNVMKLYKIETEIVQIRP